MSAILHNDAIRRLRVIDRGHDASAIAQRARRTISSIELKPVNLALDAILCVRRMAVPLRSLHHLPDALKVEMSGAARPARGPVPANANAIHFADRAELLACLARDWCMGTAVACWWWPVLFPHKDLSVTLRQVWLEDGRPVPAALARIESAGFAARFLTLLSPADVAVLWRNVVNAFDLPALAEALNAVNPTAANLPRGTAPWSPWIEPEASLGVEAARVLVAAVLLERAPSVVRSGAFARAVRAWTRASQAVPAERNEAPLVPRVPVEEVPPLAVECPPGSPPNVVFAANQRTAPVTRAEFRSAATTAPLTPELPPAEELPSPENGTPLDPPEARPALEAPPAPVVGANPFRPSPFLFDEYPDLGCAPAPDRIETEWGGVLYLVNVALALGLYGDFTTPAKPGLALPLWDFLALTGERMIGDAFAADPLSALFARLSGRGNDEPPGAHFEPLDGEPLTLWLDRICDALHERLAAALGISDAAALRVLVLQHHARIEADSGRVDVRFSLAALPIELRIAGLDRDPGWVPAGGRSITFHYE